MTQKTFYVASDGMAFVPNYIGEHERLTLDLYDLKAVFVKNNKEAYEACFAYENNIKNKEQ